ncbi:MAG: DUF1800 family protein [Planctomycetes bacterium]|nr:DUF1800 family protein [Planctomycetota bacterium]
MRYLLRLTKTTLLGGGTFLVTWIAAVAAPGVPEKADLRAIGHLLSRAAHGPTPAEVKRVQAMGIQAWIDEQLAPESIDDGGVQALVEPLLEERAGGKRIKGIDELKALAHVYAIYSRRQLQAVLGELWENHFTTDFDKVAKYIDELRSSDASDAFSTPEARKEAAHLEHQEFEFLRKHALGGFGDLLRFSAKSPAMLIYLDSVLNVRGSANENYAREILELHAFGVDNGYVQADIEQLAKCFTGWGVAKVARENAANPHAPIGMQVADDHLAAPAEATPASEKDWRYLKGSSEPPAGWKDPSFDDSAWLKGAASIGYGDDDDATVLGDMQNNYTTVYLRKAFTLKDPPARKQHLILSVVIDDGFVAYLNGAEVARFNAPGEAGKPVPFDALASQAHEAGRTPVQFNLNAARDRLVAGKNVLAIHVLNVTKGSTDLTVTPSLIERDVLPGSIETGDPRGVFAFHFVPDLHNGADVKTLFKGSPAQLEVEGKAGTSGLEEAEAAIARILEHPSTALFVCSKLIQKLAGDEIDFRKPSEGPYAGLLKRAVEAWNASSPKGSIVDVARTILTSEELWSERAHRSKVKDPFEYIASGVRALGGQTSGRGLVGHLHSMGMALFTRDEPDGWPEPGLEVVDIGTFRSRVAFAAALSEGASGSDPCWDPVTLLEGSSLESPEAIAGALDDLLFQGTLPAHAKAVVQDYLTTGDDGKPLPLRRDGPDFLPRLRQAVGLMLSLPQWQYQ